MRFTIYSYTFYENKDKMKEIQVALRSLQLRKKEMKEIILIGAVMAMFAFGFYIMDKVDQFLKYNRN